MKRISKYLPIRVVNNITGIKKRYGKAYCSHCHKKTTHVEENGIKLTCIKCGLNERRIEEVEII